jgi:lambda repressor-like predicted transcriptional regulator
MEKLTKNSFKHKFGISFKEFATKNGFNESTVSTVFIRWCGKKGYPQGKTTKAIIAKIEKEIGCDFYIKD